MGIYLRYLIASSVVVGLWTGVVLAKNDGKLAAIRAVFVEPVDDLGDDVGLAACFALHLPTLTPIKVVPKEEAEAVMRVSAHL
ncbi:MAG: hypothetical protein C5B54_04295, partial [Acidobacteria bacterium]